MKKTLKRARAYVLDNWLLGVVILGCSIVAGSLLALQLGSLTGGLSESEYYIQQLAAQDKVSLEAIIRAPIDLPYSLALYLLSLTPFTGPTGIRAISAVFGLLSVIGMFYIFKSWYTTRIAVLGTALYATTSWFLHTARFADPSVNYLLLPLLVAAMIALQVKQRSRIAISAVTIFGISALYIPGVIWFLLPAIYIKRRVLIKALRLQPIWYKISMSVTSLVMLTPLVVMLVKPIPGMATAVQNLKVLLGLPESGLQSPLDMFGTLKDELSDIFVYNTAGPIYAPGHLPWLDICTTVLVLLGVAQFVKHWRLDRSKLIGILLVLSFVLIAMGGAVSSVILLPFLFLLGVEGLRWLLSLWLEVFPRNPFARGFGLSVIIVIVLSVSVYQLNRYYLAWGQAPETHAVFDNTP